MTDKSSIQQVLGSLMKRPQLLSEVDKYSLTIADFSNRFERYIFSAIFGLYQQGVTDIQPIDVANFLEVDTVGKKTFENQNGIEFLHPSTPIELVRRLTEQEFTPSTEFTAFSTRATQAAQLMPVTSYFTMRKFLYAKILLPENSFTGQHAPNRFKS